jgi:hypothetical protein
MMFRVLRPVGDLSHQRLLRNIQSPYTLEDSKGVRKPKVETEDRQNTWYRTIRQVMAKASPDADEWLVTGRPKATTADIPQKLT